jgi:hypothetical protein
MDLGVNERLLGFDGEIRATSLFRRRLLRTVQISAMEREFLVRLAANGDTA